MNMLHPAFRLALGLAGVAALLAALAAAEVASPAQTLHALREQTEATVKSVAEDQRTEAAFALMLKGYDAFAAGARNNPDLGAEILDACVTIYADLIGDTPKAVALLAQLQREFSATTPGRTAAARISAIEARRNEAKKIHATRSSTYETGARRSATLGGDTTLFGNALPSGATVYLHRDGSLARCFLSRPTKLQGHLCKGGRFAEWATSFHRDGTLRVLWLEADEVIQGVPCKSATRGAEMVAGQDHSAVEFHANGKLARAKVSTAVEVHGIVFQPGEIAMFDVGGHPLKKERDK